LFVATIPDFGDPAIDHPEDLFSAGEVQSIQQSREASVLGDLLAADVVDTCTKGLGEPSSIESPMSDGIADVADVTEPPRRGN
jgi:hypothetical protein